MAGVQAGSWQGEGRRAGAVAWQVGNTAKNQVGSLLCPSPTWHLLSQTSSPSPMKSRHDVPWLPAQQDLVRAQGQFRTEVGKQEWELERTWSLGRQLIVACDSFFLPPGNRENASSFVTVSVDQKERPGLQGSSAFCESQAPVRC